MKNPMEPQEVTTPENQPTKKQKNKTKNRPTVSTLCAQCFPTPLAGAKEWGGRRLSTDPRVSGAISSAACWGNRHCYGNNRHSNKFQGVQKGAVIQDSSYGASGQKSPRGPITWEVTHREASHPVAAQHMLGGESTWLHGRGRGSL